MKNTWAGHCWQPLFSKYLPCFFFYSRFVVILAGVDIFNFLFSFQGNQRQCVNRKFNCINLNSTFVFVSVCMWYSVESHRDKVLSDGKLPGKLHLSSFVLQHKHDWNWEREEKNKWGKKMFISLFFPLFVFDVVVVVVFFSCAACKSILNFMHPLECVHKPRMNIEHWNSDRDIRPTEETTIAIFWFYIFPWLYFAWEKKMLFFSHTLHTLNRFTRLRI